jgi:hypothetical protein
MIGMARQLTEVGGYPVVLSQGGSGAGLPRTPRQTFTIDFDILTRSDTLFKVANVYSDLSWHNWIAAHNKFYGGHGDGNATTSG